MNPAAVLKKNPGLLERDLGDAVVVMTAEGKELHTLKASALLLWQLIDGVRTSGDLVAALVAEYEVDENRARTDVEAFAASLEKAGLIVPRG